MTDDKNERPDDGGRLGTLYDLVTGDEDARVCKDIPDAACRHLPRNFFAYLVSNLLTKVADELASARLVLPWLLSSLGAPTAFTGFLVPIRESGVLVPQLFVAAYIRRLPRRRGVWLLGAALSGLTIAIVGWVATGLSGVAAGWAVLGLLVLHSLARGLCSVSAKDVLGKTVSKRRRGTLMGYSAALAGAATLAVGLYLEVFQRTQVGVEVFVALLLGAGGLWFVALGVFTLIREQPGATEGGGNAVAEALKSLSLLQTDAAFRYFVVTRALLLSVALAPPFYVVLAQQSTDAGLAGLGMMIIASGLAGSLSAPVWGRLGDRSSRLVMSLAAACAGLLGVGVFALVELAPGLITEPWLFASLFLALAVFHNGVRLGRKVYLVDMATAETRASYVAISNTVIGVAMLGGGFIGVLGDIAGTPVVVLVLGLLSLIAAQAAWRLPEVSG
jgi:hypothetical protein